MAYAPTYAFTVEAVPTVGQITTVDQRGESDPTWIGAVRGGFGNPLKVLHTARPLSDIVNDAFREALRRRRMLAPEGSGQVDLGVTIVAFDSTKYIRREANVDLILELHERSSGRPVYRDEVKANPLEGSVFAMDNGIFGSADELGALAQAAMNQAIDAALSKPGFAAALHPSP